VAEDGVNVSWRWGCCRCDKSPSPCLVCACFLIMLAVFILGIVMSTLVADVVHSNEVMWTDIMIIALMRWVCVIRCRGWNYIAGKLGTRGRCRSQRRRMNVTKGESHLTAKKVLLLMMGKGTS